LPNYIRGSSNLVTYNGDSIITYRHNGRFGIVKAKLDPEVPKIQPASFQRIWWPTFRVGFGTKGI